MAVKDVADAFFGDIPDLVGKKGKLVGSFLGYCRRRKGGERNDRNPYFESRRTVIMKICMHRRKLAKRANTKHHQISKNKQAREHQQTPKDQKSKYKTLIPPPNSKRKKMKKPTHPNLLILRPSGQIFSIRTETHATDVQVAGFTRRFICKDAVCWLVLLKVRGFKGKVEFEVTRWQ